MSEQLQEYCDSRGVRMRVDRESGVIRGVKILGLKSRNGRSYLPEALREAAALYENAKVNVNHPKGHPASPRDYQDRLGQIRGVELRPEEGLFGDLHFNPKHALAEQLAWDAEHAPENVGFSHNVEARTSKNGEEVVVEAITRVQSVDLVADPATTRGLFESLDAKANCKASDQASRDLPDPRRFRSAGVQPGRTNRPAKRGYRTNGSGDPAADKPAGGKRQTFFRRRAETRLPRSKPCLRNPSRKRESFRRSNHLIPTPQFPAPNPLKKGDFP